MRHPLTVRERPEAGPVEAVIFDWSGSSFDTYGEQP